jgi:hypothetical protein
MEILNVIVAAAACWAFGAGWYGLLATPWMAASGVKLGPDGKPANGSSPLPYAVSLVMMVIVAGMMRHVFAMSPSLDSIADGLMTGLGVGAFFITPWIAINNAYTMRPLMLTVIDGAYATIGCAIIGVVLVLF